MPGTVPPISGGLFTMFEDCVAMEDVEFDRVGDGGRALTKEPVAGGDGAANELAEFRCWWLGGKGEGGAKAAVGVGTGVGWLEGPTPAEDGVFPAISSPL